MILSMTGFATTTSTIKQQSGESLDISNTIKTLNERYVDVNCRLPHILSHLEPAIIKYLKKELLRGTIYVNVQVANPSALKTNLLMSLSLINNYLDALNRAQKQFNIAGSTTVSDLIHLPHIFEFPDTPIDEKTSKQILDAIHTLTAQVISVRKQEGATLKKDIETRIKQIKTHYQALKKQAKLAFDTRKKTLLAQLKALLKEAPNEIRDQALQSLYIQLGKYDINEELVRFEAHIDNLQKTINTKTIEKGKKIDFITQELFRVINTLAAKANNAKVSNLAISIKLEIEKIREQGQNIV